MTADMTASSYATTPELSARSRKGLSRETMIERMLASDRTFDGRFLTGVLTTGIYCLPSCPAPMPPRSPPS